MKNKFFTLRAGLMRPFGVLSEDRSMLGRQDAWKLGCCCPLIAFGYPPTLVSPSTPWTLLLRSTLVFEYMV